MTLRHAPPARCCCCCSDAFSVAAHTPNILADTQLSIHLPPPPSVVPWGCARRYTNHGRPSHGHTASASSLSSLIWSERGAWRQAVPRAPHAPPTREECCRIPLQKPSACLCLRHRHCHVHSHVPLPLSLSRCLSVRAALPCMSRRGEGDPVVAEPPAPPSSSSQAA